MSDAFVTSGGLHMKLINWFFGLMVLTVAGVSIASTHRSVSGEVVLSKSCGKTAISEFRLLIQQETAVNYGRYQVVPLEENGRYTVLLHESYHYNFRVIAAGDYKQESLGGVRFDYQQVGKVPVITAICKIPDGKP